MRLRSSKVGGSSSPSAPRNHRGGATKTAGKHSGEAEKLKAAREVRARLKRARAARGMLQDLEEEIREFVKVWVERRQQLLSSRTGQAGKERGKGKDEIGIDSEDEEIVFVGRDGRMKGESDDEGEDEEMVKVGEDEEMKDEEEIEMVKLVLDSPVNDRDAGFRYVSLPSIHSLPLSFSLSFYLRVSVLQVSYAKAVCLISRTTPGIAHTDSSPALE